MDVSQWAEIRRLHEIEKLSEAGSKGLSMRIFKDQKTASINSSDFNREMLDNMIVNAIKRAELSSPDPFAGLPELDLAERSLVDSKFLDIYDPKIVEMAPEKKIELSLKDKVISKTFHR